MGTLTHGQMYDHTLVTVKGPGRLTRLDYAAAPKTGEAIAPGMVCSIDANGEMIAGCPNGSAGNRPMAMFALQDTDAFDANSDSGNISGGVQSAVVATGGFEVQSTEFDSGETYAPNDLLKDKAGADDGTLTLLGQAPYGNTAAVGCVSKGVETNKEGVSVLTFWTCWLPAGS